MGGAAAVLPPGGGVTGGGAVGERDVARGCRGCVGWCGPGSTYAGRAGRRVLRAPRLLDPASVGFGSVSVPGQRSGDAGMPGKRPFSRNIPRAPILCQEPC